MNINDLGFSDFYIEELQETADNFSIGRVLQVNRESYNISDGNTEYFGKPTGNMIFSSDSPEDLPTVGDFVIFQNFDYDSLAVIHKVLRRKTLLKRKAAGKKIEYQLIGANVDHGIIMQGLDNDFSINRLERYLVMLKEFQVEPIILFSKTDVLKAEELIGYKTEMKNRYPGIPILFISNFSSDDISEIRSSLMPGNTYCLIGSSGVGKSTLINNLMGKDILTTQEVRQNDSKGRHTTTNRQLIILKNGAMIIDSPGMRELANISVGNGIDNTFDEISSLAENCKFGDCSHTVEKGCAVIQALEDGVIEQSRYNNFIKLRKESEYYERSYYEKRRRDKEFGKMVKSILKHKKKK
jgi:ribosome biogenesis GTPase